MPELTLTGFDPFCIISLDKEGWQSWVKKSAVKRDKFISDSSPAARFGRRVKQRHSWGYEANRLTPKTSRKFVASFDVVPVPEPANGRGGEGEGWELKDKQICWWILNLHFYGHCGSVVDDAHDKAHESLVFKRTKPGHGCARIRERSQERRGKHQTALEKISEMLRLQCVYVEVCLMC